MPPAILASRPARPGLLTCLSPGDLQRFAQRESFRSSSVQPGAGPSSATGKEEGGGERQSAGDWGWAWGGGGLWTVCQIVKRGAND